MPSTYRRIPQNERSDRENTMNKLGYTEPTFLQTLELKEKVN